MKFEKFLGFDQLVAAGEVDGVISRWSVGGWLGLFQEHSGE